MTFQDIGAYARLGTILINLFHHIVELHEKSIKMILDVELSYNYIGEHGGSADGHS